MKNLTLFTTFLLLGSILFVACEKDENKVTGVSLNKSALSVFVNETEQLVATITPTDADDLNVLWLTSDATVASVNNGLVTGISAGTASITAETVDGGFKAACQVTVVDKAIEVTAITLSTTQWAAVPGETKQLNYVIEPDNATNQTVTWASSSNDVATVSSSGLVTAVAAGNATITVTTSDGAKNATCSVTVSPVGRITEIMQKGFVKNAHARSIDLACNELGFLYMANITPHSSDNTKGLVQVHKYSGSGTTWTKFSGLDVGVSGSESYTPSIAIKNDGTVFVAYQYYDNLNDNKYQLEIVSAFDGSNWVTLGGDGTTNTNCLVLGNNTYNQGSRTQMAFKQDGTLMLAACHYGDGYVQYYDNGADWNMLAAGDWKTYSGYKLDNDSYWAGNVNLAIFENKPYAYIRSSSGTISCGVLEGSETNGQNVQWQWLGDVLVGADIGGDNRDFETPLAISSSGQIYTSYQKAVSSARNVYVKHFNKENNSWETIFTKDFGEFSNEAEVIISNDVLFLAVARYNGAIEIYKYNTELDNWIFEGSTPNIGANYYTIDLVAGTNGEFYMAYAITDSGSDFSIGAFKYTPPTK